MKKELIYLATAVALLFSSCASELDTNPAGDKVSDEQLAELVKKDPDLVLGPMMLGAINFMHDGSRSSGTDECGFMVWHFGMDMQGNDMVLSKTDNWFASEYMFENIREQTSAYTGDRWYCYYKMVYYANQILDLIPEDATGNAKIYKAQALTYRALAYYYLMCIYQNDYMHGGKDKPGVPLYLTVEGAKGRTPSTEVFTTIADDLKTAIALFEQEGYNSHDTTSDVDAGVANLVLARVAVTMGDYTTAASAASAVIAGGYSLMNEEQYTTSGFQSATLPETIWAYTWSSGTSLENRSFASWISRTAIDNANNKGRYICIDNRLYDKIPDTDYRKACFNPTAEGGYPAYITTKFDTPTYRVDEIYMRLSEAYLLKAEAEARAGNDAAAQQTLYALVSKRDSGYAKSTKSGAALLEEIFLQSRIELWGEGHEFFTNKRFNVGVDRTSSANHNHKVVLPAGDNYFTYQIPQSLELNSNPYITSADQNPL